MTTDSCRLCGGVDLRTFHGIEADTRTPLSLVECRNCLIAWQWPVARTEPASAIYFEDLYRTQSGYFADEAVCARALLQLDLLDTFAGPATLLDVGGGTGDFARMAAERGWNVTVVDPAAKPQESDGLRILRGTLSEFPPQQFKVVCLWDVIEHVEDFEALLRAAAARLQSDGILVVETGNYQSLDRIAGGADWWCFQADHRWYLAPGVLETTLKKLGFATRLHDRTLRPHWKRQEPPGLSSSLKAVIRGSPATFGIHHAMRRIKTDFPDWYHLPIFTLLAARDRNDFTKRDARPRSAGRPT